MYITSLNNAPRGVPDDGILGQSPEAFFGDVTPNGNAEPWRSKAIGSIYVVKSSGSVAVFLKTAANDADADWSLLETGGVVNVTAATLTADRITHAGKVTTINKADGTAVTLPAATGTGDHYFFYIGTTITSNSTTFKVANASDIMVGMALLNQDGADTVVGFETAADTDTVTLNGSTTGGIKGATVEFRDMATNEWSVRVISNASGTEATPFSATVS